MITYSTKSIMRTEGVRVIPVNTKGVTGAGLALSWSKRFPADAAMYRDFCRDAAGTFEGGDILMLSGTPPTVLVATKEDWRNPSRIEWVEMIARHLAERTRKPIGYPVLIPQLGCGLGGLDWREVRPILIQHLAPNTNNTFVLFGPSAVDDAVTAIARLDATTTLAAIEAAEGAAE